MDQNFIDALADLKKSFDTIDTDKTVADTGGKRKFSKGKAVEIFVDKTIIVPAAQRKGILSKPGNRIRYTTAIPKEIGVVEGSFKVDNSFLNPNQDLNSIVEVKDYGDKPQFGEAIFVYQTLVKSVAPNLKGFFISLHAGSPDKVREDLININGWSGRYHAFCILPLKRNSQRSTYLHIFSDTEIYDNVNRVLDEITKLI